MVLGPPSVIPEESSMMHVGVTARAFSMQTGSVLFFPESRFYTKRELRPMNDSAELESSR